MPLPIFSRLSLKHYLTLIYSFALGLALVLALLAGIFPGDEPQTAPQTASVNTAQPPVLTPVKTSLPQTDTPPLIPTFLGNINKKPPSTLGVSADQLKGLHLTFWHPWAGKAGTAMQSILYEFNRTNAWGIIVQASAYGGFGELDDAVEAALGTDSMPDVMLDYSYQTRHWDAGNVFADLVPYVNDPAWGLTAQEQADFYPAFWSEDLFPNPGSSQVKRLGIPFYRSAYALFYNQSWAGELGYPSPPASVEDFQLQACAAAEAIATSGNKQDQGKGGWLVTAQPGVAIGWIYANGGNITIPNREEYLFNNAGTQEAFDFIKGLLKSSCAWADDAANPQAELAGRRALFIVDSLLNIPAQRQAFKDAGSTDTWQVIPFPSDSAPVVDTYGPSLVINHSNPARQLAAWLMLKWLVSPSNQAAWATALTVYPVRQSSLDFVKANKAAQPQWAEALMLLPEARSEPSIASWSVMRWVLGDAIGQLITPQFTADQIPMLLQNLDGTASEISTQVH